MIDGILFETVPLTSEIVAMRKAASQYQHEGKSVFISMVFPSGRLPGWDIEADSSIEGIYTDKLSTQLGMQAIVQATFTPADGQATVHGIGINCTKPRYLKELVLALNRAMRTISHTEPPTLLIYPDGGAEWVKDHFEGSMTIEEWCQDVWNCVKLAVEARPRVWGRVIVGGCCNTGPTHIQRLHEIVSASMHQ